MISKNFAWTMFVAFAIAIAFFLYVNISQTNDVAAPTTEAPVSVSAQKDLPAPTGNVDDLTKDLLNSAESEQTLTAGEDSDKTLIDADVKIFDEFGQSYNDNEL
jgi:cytoskeletal protein RodZ